MVVICCYLMQCFMSQGYIPYVTAISWRLYLLFKRGFGVVTSDSITRTYFSVAHQESFFAFGCFNFGCPCSSSSSSSSVSSSDELSSGNTFKRKNFSLSAMIWATCWRTIHIFAVSAILSSENRPKMSCY